MLIDTHAHIYLDRFTADLDAVLDRARNAGVTSVIMPAIDVPSIHRAIELSETYDGLFAMAAIHPSEVKSADDADLEAVAELSLHPKVVAIGESGLDYYWDRTFDDRQQDCFRRHIRLAAERDLPLILHNREATEDILRILEDERTALAHPKKLRGILHCYVDDAATASRAQDLGFLVGIGGVVTFKNSALADHVKDIPLEQIVIETDAPFLAPHPHRGKRNEPAYVRLVAEKIAEIKQVPFRDIAAATTGNARRLFGLV